MTNDLGKPLLLVTPMVARITRREMARVTRRAREKGRPRARAKRNGTEQTNGMVRVRATISRRRFVALDRNHEPVQPRHPKRTIRTLRGQTVRPDKVVQALSLHAQHRVKQGNVRHAMPNGTASPSGRAVFATRLAHARSGTSDLMALPAPRP